MFGSTAGSTAGSTIHLLKHKGLTLACSKTQPVTLIGFRDVKSVGMVKKRVSENEFVVERFSPSHYTVRLVGKRELPLNGIEVSSNPTEYMGLIVQLNSIHLAVITEVVVLNGIIKLIADPSAQLKDVHCDPRMVKGNLEKIFLEG